MGIWNLDIKIKVSRYRPLGTCWETSDTPNRICIVPSDVGDDVGRVDGPGRPPVGHTPPSPYIFKAPVDLSHQMNYVGTSERLNAARGLVKYRYD